MSTTTERSVALTYASSQPGRAGLVFEIPMGMVDRGADISWLSQYPHERECLFPPLTFLKPTGKTLSVPFRGRNFMVIEVVPQFGS